MNPKAQRETSVWCCEPCSPHCNHMSLSYRKGDRTKRDDTAIAELKAGQDKIFELLQGLAGELRELKGSVGAVQTGFARSSWEQRDQETMKSVKAGKPWELGFGIAPAPTPSKEQRPSKDVVTSYTRLEDEKDGEDEKNGGATVVAGKRPPGAGIPQYADVAEMGRNFANDSGGGPVVGQLLVNAADSDPVKALTKMVGFVIIGYAIYGSHPYRINNYDEVRRHSRKRRRRRERARLVLPRLSACRPAWRRRTRTRAGTGASSTPCTSRWRRSPLSATATCRHSRRRPRAPASAPALAPPSTSVRRPSPPYLLP